MINDWPKTELCCGLKPKRTFYQTGFRDDEGYWVFKCLQCKSGVQVENNYRGTSKSELEATIEWNTMCKQRPMNPSPTQENER